MGNRFDWDYDADVAAMSPRELARVVRRMDELSEAHGLLLDDSSDESGDADEGAALDDADDSGDSDAEALDDSGDEDSESLDDLNTHEPAYIQHQHGKYGSHWHNNDANHASAPPAIREDVDDSYRGQYEGMAGQHGDYHRRAGDPQGAGNRGVWLPAGQAGRRPPEPWANWQADRQAMAMAPANASEVHELADGMARRRGRRLANLTPTARMKLFERVARATGYGRGAELAGEFEPDEQLAEANDLEASARQMARQSGVRLSEMPPVERLLFYERVARRVGYGRPGGAA